MTIVQSTIQINVTVYIDGNSELLEGSINNEQFIEVLTFQTAFMFRNGVYTSIFWKSKSKSIFESELQ
jgi:hypothetical protein